MKLSEVFKAVEDGKKLQVKFKSKKTFEDFDILVLRDLTFKELEECQFQYAPIIINGHTLYPFTTVNPFRSKFYHSHINIQLRFKFFNKFI